MVELTIDGQGVKVSRDATLLDAARELGIEIPTMCHLSGYEHFTSCMVCMVEEKANGRLLPACSTMVAQGMDISTGSQKASRSRKTAIELLLSEHVGDCDGPCHVVCKAGINIPLMIRNLADGKTDEAAAVVRNAVPAPRDPCFECSGRCEKACRRRQHDGAVAIRLLVRYALEYGQPVHPCSASGSVPNRFNCNMGKIHAGEMEVFLASASDAGRIEPAAGQERGYNAQEAAEEARRCLHCDCRKRLDCKLRDYATRHEARQRRYAFAERKHFRQVRQGGGVVYEPGKCIKCGICVRITARQKEELGLTFIGRGFDVEVGVPFDESLEKALKNTAAECVGKCPTAALAFLDAGT